MITTLCLNPCIDRTVEVAAFCQGGLNRILSSRVTPSGKGVNVAVALQRLGLQAACLAPLYEENGGLIEKNALEAGVEGHFIMRPGAVRVNMKVLERSTGSITEINECGPRMDAALLEDILEAADALARKSRFLVLTGSLPPGCPTDVYGDIVRRAGALGCRAVLDAEGEAFEAGLRQDPFLVKPNAYELSLFAGRPLSGTEDTLQAALGLCRHASYVCVSMGGDGALITDGKQAFLAPALQVKAVSTVGAGDCMVAGLLYAFENGGDIEAMLKSGTAAAAACVTAAETVFSGRDVYDQMLERVRVQRLM